MQWTRSSYDATLIRCEEMPGEIWKSKLVSLVQNLETTPEFQIRNNGYRRFPEVFATEGVKGLFKGHAFSIWSDQPGEILLKHDAVPRSAVEPLCDYVKKCWLALSNSQANS